MLPRAEFDVEAALGCRAPDRRRRPGARGRRAATTPPSGSTASGHRACACPPTSSPTRWIALDPAVRAALEESIRRARLVHADQRRTDTTTQVTDGGTVTERWVPVDRVGPLRARRPGGLPEQRRHERRPRPARRGAEPGGRQPAAGRPRRLAAPHHPRRLRPARRRRGVGDGRCPGRRGVRVRGRGRRRRLRAGQPRHRAGQHLRRGGQADAQGRHRHRRRGRPHRDRGARRRQRGCRARRRPTSCPRPSTTRWLPRCSSPTHAELADAVEGALARRVAATKHTERVGTALAGTPVGHRARRRPRRRARPRQRLRRRAPRDPDPGRRRASPPGCATPGRCSSAPGRRSASATTAPGPTTCCRPAGVRATAAGCRCSRSCAASTSSRTRREALREVGATSSPWPRRGPPRPRRGGARAPPRDRPDVVTGPGPERPDPGPPLGRRGDAASRPAGRTPYGAPQLDVPVALNTNENSYAVPPRRRRGHDRRRGRRRGRASTATRTASSPPCGRPWPPTSRAAARRSRATRSGRATAPTRCSCTCSRPSAGPGARRWASRRPTRCTRSSRRRRARRGSTGCAGSAAGERSTSTRHPPSCRCVEHRPDVVFLCSPNNPTGTALDLDVVVAVHDAAEGALVVVDEAYAEFARPGTPERPHPARADGRGSS